VSKLTKSDVSEVSDIPNFEKRKTGLLAGRNGYFHP